MREIEKVFNKMPVGKISTVKLFEGVSHYKEALVYKYSESLAIVLEKKVYGRYAIEELYFWYPDNSIIRILIALGVEDALLLDKEIEKQPVFYNENKVLVNIALEFWKQNSRLLEIYGKRE